MQIIWTSPKHFGTRILGKGIKATFTFYEKFCCIFVHISLIFIWLHLINVKNLHSRTRLLKGPFHTTKLNYHHCKWQILREWTSSDFPCQFFAFAWMYCHTQVFSHILCINYIWALIPRCGKIQFEIAFDFSFVYFREQDWIGIKTLVLKPKITSWQVTPLRFKLTKI